MVLPIVENMSRYTVLRQAVPQPQAASCRGTRLALKVLRLWRFQTEHCLSRLLSKKAGCCTGHHDCCNDVDFPWVSLV
jgi:hypothetical protein